MIIKHPLIHGGLPNQSNPQYGNTTDNSQNNVDIRNNSPYHIIDAKSYKPEELVLFDVGNGCYSIHSKDGTLESGTIYSTRKIPFEHMFIPYNLEGEKSEIPVLSIENVPKLTFEELQKFQEFHIFNSLKGYAKISDNFMAYFHDPLQYCYNKMFKKRNQPKKEKTRIQTYVIFSEKRNPVTGEPLLESARIYKKIIEYSEKTDEEGFQFVKNIYNEWESNNIKIEKHGKFEKELNNKNMTLEDEPRSKDNTRLMNLGELEERRNGHNEESSTIPTKNTSKII